MDPQTDTFMTNLRDENAPEKARGILFFGEGLFPQWDMRLVPDHPNRARLLCRILCRHILLFPVVRPLHTFACPPSQYSLFEYNSFFNKCKDGMCLYRKKLHPWFWRWAFYCAQCRSWHRDYLYEASFRGFYCLWWSFGTTRAGSNVPIQDVDVNVFCRLTTL
jgi:hypothetical protein